jgi:EAL domain-containing protein (putative c-di-GMP-specific phosphodiesterase class I)
MLETIHSPLARSGAQDKRSSAPSKGTVLVVDDELMVARVYSRSLGAEGYRVLTATDGETAEMMFRRCDFDAVISDVSMPGIDGIQLLQAMRRIHSDVPVIMATGDHADAQAQRAVAAGALMYLVKPIDLRSLSQIVSHAIHLHRLGMPVRPAEPHRASADRGELSARFDAALERLWIAYQPIVSWASLEISGYEALVRSDEPSLGDPDALFGAAAELDRTPELGRAIRARVAAAIPNAPVGARIFVNVHTADLQGDALYAAAEPLREHAGRIVLEITERDSLDRVKDLAGRLAKLRAAGFHIAVDDLGAGYAGLASFVELKPSVVKLDACLIRDIHKSDTKRRIVQAMVLLCRDMAIELVAEGVETDEERRTLGFLGCRLQQGFIYARPERRFVTVGP